MQRHLEDAIRSEHSVNTAAPQSKDAIINNNPNSNEAKIHSEQNFALIRESKFGKTKMI